jgi:hypothetical protein
MFMVKILVNHLINICRHQTSQKIHVNAWNFECEMDPQGVKLKLLVLVNF